MFVRSANTKSRGDGGAEGLREYWGLSNVEKMKHCWFSLKEIMFIDLFCIMAQIQIPILSKLS